MRTPTEVEELFANISTLCRQRDIKHTYYGKFLDTVQLKTAERFQRQTTIEAYTIHAAEVILRYLPTHDTKNDGSNVTIYFSPSWDGWFYDQTRYEMPLCVGFDRYPDAEGVAIGHNDLYFHDQYRELVNVAAKHLKIDSRPTMCDQQNNAGLYKVHKQHRCTDVRIATPDTMNDELSLSVQAEMLAYIIKNIA